MRMDYTEVLRRLTVNDPQLVVQFNDGERGPAEPLLDPRSLALVRVAALIAVGGAVPSFGALADAAIASGVTVAEIVDVLVGVIPVVGLPRVVDAAPKLAPGLGYDVEDALEKLTRSRD
jgi:4-carboxymuconolactone decarboxylase